MRRLGSNSQAKLQKKFFWKIVVARGHTFGGSSSSGSGDVAVVRTEEGS